MKRLFSILALSMVALVGTRARADDACANQEDPDWHVFFTQGTGTVEEKAAAVRKAKQWYVASKTCHEVMLGTSWATRKLRGKAKLRLDRADIYRRAADELAISLASCVPAPPTAPQECYDVAEPCWAVALGNATTKNETVVLLRRANAEYEAANTCLTATKGALTAAKNVKAAMDAKALTNADLAKDSKDAAEALEKARVSVARATARLTRADTYEKAALVLDNHVGVNVRLAERPRFGLGFAVAGFGGADGVTVGAAGLRLEFTDGQNVLYDIALDAARLTNIPKSNGGHDDTSQLGFLGGARIDLGNRSHWLALGLRLAMATKDSPRLALLPEVGYSIRLGGVRGCSSEDPLGVGSIRLFAAPWIPVDGARTSVLFGAELAARTVFGRNGDRKYLGCPK